jgi:hypothetical protein
MTGLFPCPTKPGFGRGVVAEKAQRHPAIDHCLNVNSLVDAVGRGRQLVGVGQQLLEVVHHQGAALGRGEQGAQVCTLDWRGKGLECSGFGDKPPRDGQ